MQIISPEKISPVALLIDAGGFVDPPVVYDEVTFRREYRGPLHPAVMVLAGDVEVSLRALAQRGVRFSDFAEARIRGEIDRVGEAVLI